MTEPTPIPAGGPPSAPGARPGEDPGAGLADAPAGEGSPPVLIRAARAADRDVIVGALAEAGMGALEVRHPEEIALQVETAGCLLVTQEALDPAFVAVVGRALAGQRAWSELQVLVLADRAADVFALRASLEPDWGAAKVAYLTRPVAPLVLVTAVHTALTARMRQFLLRDQFAQEAELRRELNHRVKNILVTVQAMAKMTARSAGDDEGRFEAFQSRLAALSAVHAMLFDTPSGAMRFQAAARAILEPFGVMEEGRAGPRVSISGPGRPLAPEAAKTLALCVQELVTNALKYGALSDEAGRVELRLDVEGERARFAWREAGGPPVSPPGRRGYGTRYVSSALGALFAAEVEPRYDPEGLRIEVEGRAGPLLAS